MGRVTSADRALQFLTLTKPTIGLLVIVTAVPGLVIAAHGRPELATVLVTLVGTWLAAGSSGVFNHLIDRRIDATMTRTQRRPVASGMLPAWQAGVFGAVLAVISYALLYRYTTPMAAHISLAANIFYVVIYTSYLKHRTPMNIVIGGAAGAVGPIIGWAAVTGSTSLAAWIMFLVIFLWTPPHFWALALRYKDDYAAARIPMLPVVVGDEATRRQVLAYTLILAPAIVWLGYLVDAGALYYGVAGLSTLYFIWVAYRLYRSHSNTSAMQVFHFSCFYVLGVFSGLALDSLL